MGRERCGRAHGGGKQKLSINEVKKHSELS